MPNYIIRPEINNHKDGDYERLHEEMYKRGFYKVIQYTSDNLFRDLPTGLYRHTSELTLQQVYNECVASLNAIGKYNISFRRDFELFVAPHTGSMNDLKLTTDKTKLPPNSK